MAHERLHATRAPARVPVSAANAAPFLDSPGAASSAAEIDKDALSVILVTAGYDHTIRFWEAWSGVCSHTVQFPDSQVNRLAISPDKRFLAAAGHNQVRLYDCNIGGAAGGASNAHGASDAARGNNVNPVATFDGHAGNVTSIAWHCDAKWLVSGSEDGTLKIWDTRTSRPQRVYDHHGPVNDVVIHPNQGELISCDQNGSVKLWDLGENGCSHELVPEEEVPIRSVTVASDGSCLIAANNKGNVYCWRIQNGGYGSDGTPVADVKGSEFTDLVPVTKFRAHETYITQCALSPDARFLATCSADTTVKIWSTNQFKFGLEKTLVGHQRWVWDVAFSADSAYLVTASSDHVARLWELSSGETMRQYNGHHRAAVCVALNDSSL
ncbi:TOR complex subunit lst8 [Malassezia vespertilionis]|uniref:Protein LST8 homolog n=1 Tax=Malassezia vespertilionis TaxID=2020962 RepID=A0A2N1JE92_9BASI|nr:TOR complex subunit lst8 [Malassezia vespertilionis]PKI84868.1 Lst8p [Malassezia vespertilionis]WFD05523.1 TOR complex subunit lst8 [Malassezia vespertilionis]